MLEQMVSLDQNAAGKSRLMRIFEPQPQTGTISLDHVDPRRSPAEIRSWLGYLPHEFDVDPKTTARERLDQITAAAVKIMAPPPTG
ncbi:hypothetical protein ABENE_11225 [Asticcacaulis benevestitus DSM 16100 = ATCC BAA-896]|uniref:ABC transporter domain-containing protein n=1 Tax=Asticcacaulis benevestitus DSM 16100 = ATCC BAA-896 TaxID=1121022 RepID=V4PZL4_9CAUL|nr:hypothetical protein ABENE_11225 [Asticcacaulis benevestitus DSM 16100 = ATCC BAA-896]